MALLYMSHCQATSVVTFWTDSWVVLGTDSLRHISVMGLVRACKLVRVGDIFFAMDGELGSEAGNFDARRIAFEAMSSPGSMEGRFKIFQQSLTIGLPGLIAQRRRDRPDIYRNWAKPISPAPIMGVVFVGFEGGRSKIIICDYMLDINNPKMFAPRRVDTQRNLAPFGFGYYSGAVGKSIDDLYARSVYTMLGPEEATDRLIRAAAILFPEMVGLPVAIARIDGSGPRWIKHPSSCAE
jgi:hypothetical protein